MDPSFDGYNMTLLAGLLLSSLGLDLGLLAAAWLFSGHIPGL